MTDTSALPRAALTGAYAVIFISRRRDDEQDSLNPDSPNSDNPNSESLNSISYGATADRMVELAAQQPGYIGVRSARGSDGLGITVSYWQSLQAIAAWRAHAEHTLARERGRERWYEDYELQITRIERAYDWQREA